MSAVPQNRSTAERTEFWRSIPGASFLLMDSIRPRRFGEHEHKDIRLSFLLQGSIVEVDDRKRFVETGPMSLHVTPAYSKHSHLIRSERVTTLCFDIEPAMLRMLGDSSAVFSNPATIKSGPAITICTKMQREIQVGDAASEMILQGLVLELAGELERRKKNRFPADAPMWLRHARELLHDRCFDNVSIEEISKTVGVHSSHLARMFRTYLNESPGEYLRRLRIERATREVMVSNRPLREIGEMAGFSDQAHFSREFRRHNGITPREFRARLRR